MGIVLAQKAIQSVLRVGFLRLQKDPEYRANFLENFKEFDATFMQFNQYASQLGIAIDNFQEPVLEIEKFIKRTDFRVLLGFPRLKAQMPEICISLGADGESSGTLGNIAEEVRDENGKVTVLQSSNKHRSLQIHITDINPDSLEILYQVVDFILVTHRTLLAQMGLNNCEFDAGDVHPNQEGLEAGVFLFERITTVACDLYQTYRSGFFGHSPIANFVAMGSSLSTENDVNPDDLVDEEEEVEPTGDEFIIVGDQIATSPSANPLFRGMSVVETPTEEIVRNLSITTFDQSIVGDFIFEQVSANPEYLYFAYPKVLGEVTFKNENDVAVSFLRTELVVTNEDDENIVYFVYRSEATFTGTNIITISKVV